MPYLVTDKRTGINKLYSNFKVVTLNNIEIRKGKDMYLNIRFKTLFFTNKFRKGETLNFRIERIDMIKETDLNILKGSDVIDIETYS